MVAPVISVCILITSSTEEFQLAVVYASYFIGAYLRSANLASEGRSNKWMIENLVRQDVVYATLGL